MTRYDSARFAGFSVKNATKSLVKKVLMQSILVILQYKIAYAHKMPNWLNFPINSNLKCQNKTLRNSKSCHLQPLLLSVQLILLHTCRYCKTFTTQC